MSGNLLFNVQNHFFLSGLQEFHSFGEWNFHSFTFREYSIQIMNVYECNGTNIFIRWKMKCSIQRGEAELNSTFHLSPNENICSIARMRKHSLFVLYSLYKDSKSWTNLKEKALKLILAQAKDFYKSRVQLYARSSTRTLASH